jgi:hypothetical protein
MIYGLSINLYDMPQCGVKEMKAYPTIYIPTNNVNWGLPKLECLKYDYM